MVQAWMRRREVEEITVSGVSGVSSQAYTIIVDWAVAHMFTFAHSAVVR
jgi:hypothetical protein